jgi:hypothetical protein
MMRRQVEAQPFGVELGWMDWVRSGGMLALPQMSILCGIHRDTDAKSYMKNTTW